jgi:SAM-dependent methyltransferase
MLIEAARLCGREGPSWVQADVARLPFPKGTFDLVVSRRAMHHFPDLQHCLASMRDALRPGGAMVIDDRSVPEDDFVDRTMNHLDRLHDRSHVRQLRPSAWRDALDRCGLVLERLYTYHRRRPLSSLTQTAMEEDAREIERIVRALDAGERERMGIEVSGDSITVTHWFVLLRASRPSQRTL